MFGPQEQLLTSGQPVVKQFLSGDRFGPDRYVRGEGRVGGCCGGGDAGCRYFRWWYQDDFTEIIRRCS